MTQPSIFQVNSLEFSYDSSEAPLFTDLTFTLSLGWTGIIGANGIGKTTLLRLLCGELSPTRGALGFPGGKDEDRILCSQDIHDPGGRVEEFVYAVFEGDREALELSRRFGLAPEEFFRWKTLSPGERKRFQLAAALRGEPSLLGVDEPTNHMDARGRILLQGALSGFRGIGLLISHDRELLDALCSQTLFLDDAGAVLRPGGYSRGIEEARRERLHGERAFQRASAELRTLSRETVRRRGEAARQQVRRSKRGLALKDHDARFKKNLARISGKDGCAGKQLRQLDGRLAQARQRLEESRITGEGKRGITISPGMSKRDSLLTLGEGQIPMGPGVICHPELILKPGDRVGVTGDNGSGKTTLLEYIIPRLNLTGEELLLLPQECPPEERTALRRRLEALAPSVRGAVLSTLSRLGSDPQAVLESECPSPGEARKLLLALGIEDSPALIVLDEPTNHLDLPSRPAVEEALTPLPCALLLVSHDPVFRRRLVRRSWHLTREGLNSSLELRWEE